MKTFKARGLDGYALVSLLGFMVGGAPLWADPSSDPLRFPVTQYSLVNRRVLSHGTEVEVICRFYKNIPYVGNPVDLNYQSMNVLVPVQVAGKPVDHTRSPILLGLQVFGFMEYNILDRMREPRPVYDLALADGWVVVLPGVRGRNNATRADAWRSNSPTVWCGKAPACVVDMKAVIRYIRHNRNQLPGNPDWIVTTGGSAGGGVSAVLGSSGNSTLFDGDLRGIGAAQERDDVFASACFSPMLDFQHGDMQYEWMYGQTPKGGHGGPARMATVSSGQAIGPTPTGHKGAAGPSGMGRDFPADPDHPFPAPPSPREYVDQQLSQEIAKPFDTYLQSLNLQGRECFGLLTAANYSDYLYRFFLKPAADAYLQTLTVEQRSRYIKARPWLTYTADRGVSFSWQGYLDAFGRKAAIPVFDDFEMKTPETSLFGNADRATAHFTAFTIQHLAPDVSPGIDEALQRRVDLMNPIFHIQRADAPPTRHWWIRHGTHENGTSQTSIINLVTLLENRGAQVDMAFNWDGGHMSDFDPEAFILWIDRLTHRAGGH